VCLITTLILTTHVSGVVCHDFILTRHAGGVRTGLTSSAETSYSRRSPEITVPPDEFCCNTA
jgi:hypothetical protein